MRRTLAIGFGVIVACACAGASAHAAVATSRKLVQPARPIERPAVQHQRVVPPRQGEVRVAAPAAPQRHDVQQMQRPSSPLAARGLQSTVISTDVYLIGGGRTARMPAGLHRARVTDVIIDTNGWIDAIVARMEGQFMMGWAIIDMMAPAAGDGLVIRRFGSPNLEGTLFGIYENGKFMGWYDSRGNQVDPKTDPWSDENLRMTHQEGVEAERTANALGYKSGGGGDVGYADGDEDRDSDSLPQDFYDERSGGQSDETNEDDFGTDEEADCVGDECPGSEGWPNPDDFLGRWVDLLVHPDGTSQLSFKMKDGSSFTLTNAMLQTNMLTKTVQAGRGTEDGGPEGPGRGPVSFLSRLRGALGRGIDDGGPEGPGRGPVSLAESFAKAGVNVLICPAAETRTATGMVVDATGLKSDGLSFVEGDPEKGVVCPGGGQPIPFAK